MISKRVMFSRNLLKESLGRYIVLDLHKYNVSLQPSSELARLLRHAYPGSENKVQDVKVLVGARDDHGF